MKTDINVEIQNIIQQVHYLIKQAEKYDLMNSNKIRKNHNKIKNVFNHINMKTHIIEQTIFYFDVNIDYSVLFSDIHFDLMLLQHELMSILIMLKLECLTNADVVNKTSVLQADILADDMSLSKIIKILALIYFIYQKNL